MDQFVVLNKLLQTKNYFRLLPSIEKLPMTASIRSEFQNAKATNVNQWQQMVPMVPLAKLRTYLCFNERLGTCSSRRTNTILAGLCTYRKVVAENISWKGKHKVYFHNVFDKYY